MIVGQRAGEFDTGDDLATNNALEIECRFVAEGANATLLEGRTYTETKLGELP